MRMALKNKQRMYYALYREPQTVYEKDAEGNILYTEVDGERVPVMTGDAERIYDVPVEFIGNFVPVGSESYARGNVAIYRPYGIDIAAYDALILMKRNELPLTESSLIWLDTPPTQRITDDDFIEDGSGQNILDDTADNEEIEPSESTQIVCDETSADYFVKRVASTQNNTLFLLQRINHNG